MTLARAKGNSVGADRKKAMAEREDVLVVDRGDRSVGAHGQIARRAIARKSCRPGRKACRTPQFGWNGPAARTRLGAAPGAASAVPAQSDRWSPGWAAQRNGCGDLDQIA